MDFVSFACMCCQGRLKVASQYAGQTVLCPKCRKKTVVPECEEAAGTYGFSDAPVPKETAPRKRNAAEVWEAYGYDDLSEQQLAALEKAREHAAGRYWDRAITILNRLFNKSAGGEMTRDNAVFRKPLSYCLARWGMSELSEMGEDESAQLSKPIRQLLKGAGEMQRYGGAFEMNTCGLCRESLKGRREKGTLRTAVGKAHLCCAAPRQEDLRLIARVDQVWKKLTLATVLDDQNEEAWHALKQLPAWHGVLQSPEEKERWSSQAAYQGAAEGAAGGAFAELMLEILQTGLSG
jgi:hypothetical protein